MNKILIIVLIGFTLSNTETNDLIIIGDGRIAEMANVLFEIEYTNFRHELYDYKAIMTDEPISYKNHSIEIIAVFSYDLFLTKTDSPPHVKVHEQLKKAKKGTDVLINIGTYYLNNFNSIFIFIGKLADKYSNLNFYAVSLVGVDENLSNIRNSDIKEFNHKTEDRIEMFGFTNLKYRNILNEDNPTQIIVDGKPVNILLYVTENIYFFKNGYIKLFDAMIEGL